MNKSEVKTLRSIYAFVSSAAMAVLMVGAMAVSNADNNIATFQPVVSDTTDYTFTNGTLSTVTGGFDVSSIGPAGTTSSDALFTLAPVTEQGMAQPALGGGEEALFGPGSFSLVDNNGTGATLLSASYGSAVLQGSSSGSFSDFTLNDVVYGGSNTYVTQFLAKYGGTLPVSGTYSLSMSPINPVLTNTGPGGDIGNFTAAGGVGTFEASSTAVPEPSALVTVAMGAFALLGLMVVAHRRSGLRS